MPEVLGGCSLHKKIPMENLERALEKANVLLKCFKSYCGLIESTTLIRSENKRFEQLKSLTYVLLMLFGSIGHQLCYDGFDRF